MLHGERVVFRRPGVAELESFSLDDRDLGPTELLVRTRLTLISPGTELARLSGKRLQAGGDGPAFPMTNVGYANVGTVLAAGARVPAQPGERVYTLANHASIARIAADHSLCVPVPAGLADEQAVFTRLATVSMTTLRTTIARAGDEVAVVGLGLVGNLAAQVFAVAGMRVNAFDRAAERLALARRCGLDSVHDAAAAETFAQRHRLVIEASGSAQAAVTAVELARPGGEIVMIGAPWGGDEHSVPSGRLTRSIFLRFLTLRSGSEWALPRQPTALAQGSIHENSVTALQWLAEGRLSVLPLITQRLQPAAIAEAYAGLLDRPGEFLGVLLQWPTA